ncbi:hypothetical protein TNCV_4461841 [Trichonephila clavipes]|nr:hypothetical protein TNCV_4461841 [Trichonephila clavipes]
MSKPRPITIPNHSTHLVEIRSSVETVCAYVFETVSRAHLFASDYRFKEYLKQIRVKEFASCERNYLTSSHKRSVERKRID